MHTQFPEATPRTSSEENFLSELVRFALVAAVIVIPIRLFVAQPFVVAGASMEPTFEDRQYLIVDEISYRFGAPERGDIIIFRYPRDPSKFFIKRIIALPGETLNIEGSKITLYNNTHRGGIVLDEPYATKTERDAFLTQTLGDDEYFVLGDNRDASSDSRVWGALKQNFIVGRAFLRLLPLSRAGVFPGSGAPAEIIRGSAK